MAIPTIVTISTHTSTTVAGGGVCRRGKAVLMGKAVLILGPISAQRFFGQGAVLMGKAVLILGPISAQLSVGSLSVTMRFLCDDGVFVWRSSRDSNPVTIGPVLIFSVTIATPLC